jgi:hypothetical protein
MPVYRYFFEDLKTGTFLDELPGMYGTYMSGNLSQAGDWTGTIRMDSDYRSPQEILDVTMPGRTVVWCERDTQLIWGGILWSRTYQSDGRTCQLQARTFDAYLVKDYCDVDLNLTDYKTNIVREAFRRAFEVGSDAPTGLLDIPVAVGSDGDITYNKVLVGIDYHTWDDVVKEYVRGGVEYRIRYYKDTLGRHAALDLGRWDLGDGYMIGVPWTSTVPKLLFQYPGEISKYWWAESTANAANVLAGIGKANDASTPRATLINSASLAAGYPRLRKRYTFSETENVTVLGQTLSAMRDVVAPPMINPTLVLQLSPSTEDADFGNWNLGDYFDYVLDDPYRFPKVRRGTTRVTGWGLTPGGSDGPETITLNTTNHNAQITEAGE